MPPATPTVARQIQLARQAASLSQQALGIVALGQDARLDVVDRIDSADADWVQPIAIEKYIKERYEDVLNDLMQDSEFLKETTCTLLPAVNLQ